ncbi:enoyl-CoA hydratase/isomerase family protein [Humibacter antri]
MTDGQTLRIERGQDRVVVTLDRPRARNAIDRRMVDGLHEVCVELEAEPRILILAGGDGVFASGADIAELRDRTAHDALAGINTRLFMRIARLPMPVIAAVDGWALGGGAELAYAADFRIGTPRTVFGNPETSLGIIAAAGATWRLRELVGEPLAKQLLLAGRRLDAEESLRTGLLGEVVEQADLMPAAHRLADRIASMDAAATIATKAVFAAPADGHPDAELRAQAVLFESPEKHRRMTEFLERRWNKQGAAHDPTQEGPATLGAGAGSPATGDAGAGGSATGHTRPGTSATGDTRPGGFATGDARAGSPATGDAGVGSFATHHAWPRSPAPGGGSR